MIYEIIINILITSMYVNILWCFILVTLYERKENDKDYVYIYLDILGPPFTGRSCTNSLDQSIIKTYETD